MTHSVSGPASTPPDGIAWPGEYLTAGPWKVFARRAPALSDGAVPGIYVHGLGGGSAAWTDLMGMLGDRVEGYAVDLPGFGMSPAPAEPAYTVPAQANVVRDLLEHFDTPVHLIGNSLGAAVALRVAAACPQSVRTLTLIAPTFPDWRPRPATVAMVAPLVPVLGQRLMLRQAASSPEEQARQVLAGLTGPGAHLEPRHHAQVLADIEAAIGNPDLGTAYLAAVRGAVSGYLQRGRRGLWAAAARVTVPTLAVFGTADPFIHPRIAARTARTIPGARVLVLSGIGHLAQVEARDVVASAIRDLIGPSTG
ncbi:MAG TPA: alpha/beta hydrolase [Segeticoccus sp.]|uniref:alpha/beta fold hydrolase n=1 Tax=Segeticoccus sp. TaxID=2706531 RepID=UPI002D7E518F|nr:alpha/beta hydrolase [Segeticoccus sp.]HET8600465.1 alpha/beta hydrolase [Segeticoccus sp.]